MKKRALKSALGLGYVILVMLLLLVQAGAGAETANRWIVLGEVLLLGLPLAVVLLLYIRLTEQIRRHPYETTDDIADNASEETARRNTGSVRQKAFSYEEQYARFLNVMQQAERGLSERELEVAWLLYRGYTNRQIGEELFIAETTVKKHVSHIYEKLGVTGRKEFKAMICAEKQG